MVSRFLHDTLRLRPAIRAWNLCLACLKHSVILDQVTYLKCPLMWLGRLYWKLSFQNSDQERHNLLCPVQPLDAYVHRATPWHKNEQLFVCFGPPNKGSPASKQRIRKWVVGAISLAYELAGQPSPMAVRSHSTRSMAASKALILRVALQEVCDAAGWSWPHIFIILFSGPQVPKCFCPSAAH